MPIMRLPDTVDTALAALTERLGDDEAAAALLATVSAAFYQAVVLYEDSEARHGANLDGVASFLTRLGRSMDEHSAEIDAADLELMTLHQQVTDRILRGGNSINQARTVMRDVLRIYSEFTGNVTDLKRGVGGLIKGALSSLSPAIGAWAAPLVHRALGA